MKALLFLAAMILAFSCKSTNQGDSSLREEVTANGDPNEVSGPRLGPIGQPDPSYKMPGDEDLKKLIPSRVDFFRFDHWNNSVQ